MKLLAYIRAASRALLNRVGLNRELDEEIRSHIQMHADDLERAGLSRAEAEREARLAFGGRERFKEECRDASGISFVEGAIQDVRFAIRLLRKNPGFTIIGQRTHEIGIRMALGAHPREVFRLVIGGGLKLALSGVAIGAIAAVLLIRLLTSFSQLLYGVSGSDPLTLVAVALMLIGAQCWPGTYRRGERCGLTRWWRCGTNNPIAICACFSFPV